MDNNSRAAQNASREGDAPAEPCLGSADPQLTRSLALPTSDLPKRRHPSHGIKHVDGQPTIIFDTLCLKNRSPLLACDAFHDIFRKVAKNATAWLLGRYVIMPDHIHFVAADVGKDIP